MQHHRLHDARHFWAIRAIRAGTPYELVARQLGHASIQMVARVYGRFAPTAQDRDRWERQAATLDNVATKVASKGSSEERQMAVGDDATTNGAAGSENSWGRIRTGDPGIMSAVL